MFKKTLLSISLFLPLLSSALEVEKSELTFEEKRTWSFLVDKYAEIIENDEYYSIENNLSDDMKQSILVDYNNEIDNYFYITPTYMNIIDWIKETYPDKLLSTNTDPESFYLYDLTKDEINQIENYYNNYIENTTKPSNDFLNFNSNRDFYIPPHGIYIVDGEKVLQYQAESQEHCLLKSQNLFKVNEGDNLYFQYEITENDSFYYHQSSNNDIIILTCTMDNINVINNNVSTFFNN